MPNGPFLYADQLLSVMTAKSQQGGFKDLVIYVVCSHPPSLLLFYIFLHSVRHKQARNVISWPCKKVLSEISSCQ